MSNKLENITVIGIGRLGLAWALVLEKAGYKVIGCDIIEEYVKSLNNKSFLTIEPKINDYLNNANNISEGKEVSAGYSPPKELHHFHKMLLRLRDIEAIVIAGINGNTAGGGCEFSLGCDLRIMSEGPYAIGLPETSVGILPGGGGTQRLARLIGSSRALDLILHARLLSPQEAFEFGLINKLVPHERFREALMIYCLDLASRAPIALRQVKKIIHHGLDKTLEEGLLMEQEAFDVTMRSNDAAKAMRSMLDTENDIEDQTDFKWEGN